MTTNANMTPTCEGCKRHWYKKLPNGEWICTKCSLIVVPDEFYLTYDKLSEDGYCDDAGGCEYNRVREEWEEAGKPTGQDMIDFIQGGANAGPNQEDFPVPSPEEIKQLADEIRKQRKLKE